MDNYTLIGYIEKGDIANVELYLSSSNSYNNEEYKYKMMDVLKKSVIIGDKKIIKLLIDRTTILSYSLALIYACQYSKLEIIDYLLQFDQIRNIFDEINDDVNNLDEYNYNDIFKCFHHLCVNGISKYIYLFLSKIKYYNIIIYILYRYDIRDSLLSVLLKNGHFDLAIKLYRRYNPKRFDLLLDEKTADDNEKKIMRKECKKNICLSILLCSACSTGCLTLVEEILSLDYFWIDDIPLGLSISTAAAHGHLPIVNYFLNHHLTKKYDKRYAIEGACEGQHLEMLQYLLSLSGVKYINISKHKYEIVIEACKSNNSKILEYLISLKDRNIKIEDYFEECLDYAIINENDGVLRFIINKLEDGTIDKKLLDTPCTFCMEMLDSYEEEIDHYRDDETIGLRCLRSLMNDNKIDLAWRVIKIGQYYREIHNQERFKNKLDILKAYVIKKLALLRGVINQHSSEQI